MAYTSLNAAAIGRAQTIDSALNAAASVMGVVMAARGGELGAQGGEGLPTQTVEYDPVTNEPTIPAGFWRVGTVPGTLPIKP